MLRKLGRVTGLTLVVAMAVWMAPIAAGASSATTVPKIVVLTNASSGSTVLATKGELVVVELTGGPIQWSEASVVSPSAVSPVLAKVSGSRSATGSSRTTFRVVGSGLAKLDALGTPRCPTAGGCPQYVVLWQATVVVPVVDPPSAA